MSMCKRTYLLALPGGIQDPDTVELKWLGSIMPPDLAL